MTEDPKRSSLEDLETRLRAARSQQDQTARGGSGKGRKVNAQSGIGFAFRVGTDLVAGLVVGVGIGLLLDYWLGTKPWFLILFFLLGAAAGFLNVFRLVRGYGLAAGYKKDDGSEEDPEGEKDGR